MKLPKETRRYCPYCKKRTTQSVGVAKQKSRSATHPMSRGSASREKLRRLRDKPGNLGRRSRKAPKSWKRKTKATKRMTLLYTCKECKKSKQGKSSIRTARLEIGDKVAK
ncbi:50S ribosomal protein L44e [Candidatus Pacearchaeota archaeon CG10_big_fil_rev_8_21_14_0_10_35_219]|nr:50S ribosomal protein L44e [Candidatus Pacearchaeota archaeon]OIO41863.1 MAG: hypothetical protein AUJ63_04910 [Candidatus Pacearchaeota archaeon CG1_02_35_32]PIO07274.1 MAG: 50S ribosomal protein L44e [Candidatus Pacearchaeota archaeon CG10_big_fil_rev_8_21_14_0_10_35_219]PIY81159.1 MAG: 50S ribosomal protein L44e [Candidatus Pacearchaeota archaeon CG_4_10_14_0_8_um_filter_35_169]PIZ80018.1 MAG: 50S ribosomal protein L44e [Candidatus Pacearchaeota archaeon CG_4_10_14_0_2_um_filter_35_33]PJ